MFSPLLQDIISHNCRDLIKSVPFLQNASAQFTTAVLTKLRFEVFLKGEFIVHAGAKGDKMYFIRTGVVEVLGDDGKVATTLSDGAHFGEICLLTDDRRVASIKTVTICDLFSLSKVNFQSLLDEFPEMRCTLERVALHRLSLLGKQPKPEEIKKSGRISIVVPPPNIHKDASRIPDDVLMRCNHEADCTCACCPTANETGEESTVEFTSVETHAECDADLAKEDESMASSDSRHSVPTSSNVVPANTSDHIDKEGQKHSAF
jgi:hypothetical protein